MNLIGSYFDYLALPLSVLEDARLVLAGKLHEQEEREKARKARERRGRRAY